MLVEPVNVLPDRVQVLHKLLVQALRIFEFPLPVPQSEQPTGRRLGRPRAGCSPHLELLLDSGRTLQVLRVLEKQVCPVADEVRDLVAGRAHHTQVLAPTRG